MFLRPSFTVFGTTRKPKIVRDDSKSVIYDNYNVSLAFPIKAHEDAQRDVTRSVVNENVNVSAQRA